MKRILCQQKRHNYVKNGSGDNTISMESMSKIVSAVFRSKRSRHLDFSVPNCSKAFSSIFNHEMLRPGDMRCKKMVHLASPGVRNLLAVANSGQNHQTPPGMCIVQFTFQGFETEDIVIFLRTLGFGVPKMYTSQNLK